jgi:hypothetical protein
MSMTIEKLGQTIEKAWRARNYNPDVFPELASTLLSQYPVYEYLSPLDIVRWTQATPDFPYQRNFDWRFGEPSLALWAGSPRFYIEAVFWLDGTTSIHQHLFSGAFQLLAGSSLHTEYRFTPERDPVPELRYGRVEPLRSELLRVGDCRAILPSHQFIHALFHLERPSVTIVVRTYKDVGSDPGYEYLRPALARDPFCEPQQLVRQTQLYHLLKQVEDPRHLPMVRASLREADLFSAFFLIEHCFYAAPNDRTMMRTLLDCARERHKDYVDVWEAVLEERRREIYIIDRRRIVRQPLHRFFFALILNLPERDMIFNVIRSRFPDADPVALVLEWTRQISDITLTDKMAPNPLGFEFGDAEQAVLGELLRGVQSDDEVITRLAQQHDGITGHETEFLELSRTLRQSPLFSALCRLRR